MTTAANRRVARLEGQANSGSCRPVFIQAGEAPPANVDPRFVVTVSQSASGEETISFPDDFRWNGLEKDIQALDAMERTAA